ncbi:MAG: TonB-dependent receptor plug domain-containing protein [bacterium]
MKCSFNKDNGNRLRPVIFFFLFFAFCLLAFECMAPVCRAEEREPEESIDFTSLSLEELKQVMIISVLKRPQKLSEATSAITVITQEDIRRSGATSIPELLRGVPGFEVAQMESSTWAVSARGFNNLNANKLLVLMDGRSLYTPLFSGVYWNVQDTLFEDIDRIEVIRGPGGTLWGANAVNGVINIITKRAEDTQGGLVTSGAGNEEKRFGAFRYGEKLGDNAYSRIYIKYFEKDSFWRTSGMWPRPGIKEDEGWDSLRGGGRIDWSLSGGNSLTVQGDIYDGKDSEKLMIPDPNTFSLRSFDMNNEFSGGNMIARWMHAFSDTSDMALQLYYDRTKQERDEGGQSQYKERFDIYDFDFQHNFRLGRRQGIIWGLGYRFISDEFEASAADPNRWVFLLDPPRRETHLVSAFFQDEIDIISDRIRLTLGSKFEHNDYTGFEVQPGVRMLWNPSDIQNVWASVSRAVRTPSRSEYDTEAPIGGSPSWPSWPRSRMKDAEDLIAYELGYRIQLTKSFSLDLASYLNEYKNLNIYPDNTAEAETYGVELAAEWDALPWWRISASYTYLHMLVSQDDRHPPPPFDPNFAFPVDPNFPFFPPPFDVSLDKSIPNHQFVIHSSMDIYRNLEIDLDLRHVDNLDIFVPSYTELDARLGWKPREDLEISIVGRNLLHDHHPEFLSHGFLPYSGGENIEVERSIYGKITCGF